MDEGLRFVDGVSDALFLALPERQSFIIGFAPPLNNILTNCGMSVASYTITHIHIVQNHIFVKYCKSIFLYIYILYIYIYHNPIVLFRREKYNFL